MVRLKLDQDSLGLSSLIERMTNSKVKDCFGDDENFYIIVPRGEMGRILGKNGSTIKKVQAKLAKKVKVIEYKDNVIDFVRAVIYPVRVEEIIEEDGIIYIKDSQKKTKSLLIGREGRNLKLISRAVQRFFNVELKVV